MNTFLEIALINTVLVAVLAGVVFVVTRIWRNPHLAHMLWLLLLIKMITPPLVRVPVTLGSPANEGDLATIAPEEFSTPERARVPASVPEHADRTAVESAAVFDLSIQPPIVHSTKSMWPFYVAVIWLSGSFWYALIALVRIARFHRRLKETDVPSEALLRIGESVSRELGLKQCPKFRVTNAQLGPMVWPVGRSPLVVLPSELVTSLAEEQLRAIVAHEFGHIVRRDHWARWLEVVCTFLFWWNPCLWLARKELRTAEEVCCDALVVETYPGSPQAIGEALLSIADFLSGIPSGTPVLVSEMQGSGNLKRRIEMLLTNRISRRLPRSVKGVLLVLTLAVLPLSAQESQHVQPNPAAANSKAGEKDAPKSAQPSPEVTVEQILAAWNQYRKSIQTIQFKCTLECTEKVPTIVSESLDPLEYSALNSEDDYKRITLKQDIDFSMSGTKMAMISQCEIWDGPSSKPKTQSTITGFDGKQYRIFYPDSSLPSGSITHSIELPDALGNNTWTVPILLACAPKALLLRQGTLYKKATIVNRNAKCDGVASIELSIPSDTLIHLGVNPISLSNLRAILEKTNSNSRVIIHVSRDKGHRILGMVLESKGVKRREVTLSYIADDKVGWVLSSWRFNIYQPDGAVDFADVGKVERCTINEPIDKSVFAPTFPVGTHVYVKNGTNAFIQDPDNKLRPIAVD